MRHAIVIFGLVVSLVVTAAMLDAIARRSPAAGLVLVWNSNPAKTLSSLQPGQVRVVNSWSSGHIVQLHVETMREFKTPLAATLLAIRFPAMSLGVAGCG